MASKKTGYERQDAILGQFKRDARDTNRFDAVAQALEAGRRNKMKRALQKERKENPFVPGTLNWLEFEKENNK